MLPPFALLARRYRSAEADHVRLEAARWHLLQQHERAIDAQIDRAAAGAGAQLQRARSHGGDFLRARGESIFRAASDAASGMLAPTAETVAAAAAAGDDGCGSEAECEVAGEMKAEGTGLRQRKRK